MAQLSIFAVISSSAIGGAERYFVTLLKGLAKNGIEVNVACDAAGPMIDEYRAHSARVWPLDLSRVFNPAAVSRLSALMREAQADIVHTHLWTADLLGGLAARHARVPATLATVYGAYHLPIRVSGLRGLRRWALSRSYRAVYRCFDRVIALSDYISEDLAGRAGIRAQRKKIDVILPGFDPTPFESQRAQARREPVRAAGQARIINVANFFPIKGQEWLLRAMPRVLERFPDCRCLFIGDGPDRLSMEGLAARLRISGHVDFRGSLSNPLELVSTSDVFVLPSVSEGLPLSILEAWALGIPVVASDAGGIPEAIEHRRTGLLVPPRDPGALADAIIALLSDPNLRRRLAAAGSDRVRSGFSSESMVKRTVDLYWSLANPDKGYKLRESHPRDLFDA